MGEHSPLVRQWMMLRILSSRHYGVTVKELAEELGVSEKTIRRDLDAFSEAGFPLEETVVEHGRKKWKLAGITQMGEERTARSRGTVAGRPAETDHTTRILPLVGIKATTLRALARVPRRIRKRNLFVHHF